MTVGESYTLAGSNQKAVAISGTKAIDLTGNTLANIIIGNDGTNEIAGGAGKDTLTGKGGKDAFVFDTKASKTNVDKVTDFSVKDDRSGSTTPCSRSSGKPGPTKPATDEQRLLHHRL